MKHSWMKTRRPLYYVPMEERTEVKRWEFYACKVCVNCRGLFRVTGHPAGPWMNWFARKGDSHFQRIRHIPPCVPRPGEARCEPDPLMSLADDGGIAA